MNATATYSRFIHFLSPIRLKMKQSVWHAIYRQQFGIRKMRCEQEGPMHAHYYNSSQWFRKGKQILRFYKSTKRTIFSLFCSLSVSFYTQTVYIYRYCRMRYSSQSVGLVNMLQNPDNMCENLNAH